MNKASAYGVGDCRFESCRGHLNFRLSIRRMSERVTADELFDASFDILAGRHALAVAWRAMWSHAGLNARAAYLALTTWAMVDLLASAALELRTCH